MKTTVIIALSSQNASSLQTVETETHLLPAVTLALVSEFACDNEIPCAAVDYSYLAPAPVAVAA